MTGCSSLHNHTVFCDGADEVETMCRSAFEKGLVSIGFSSHAPVGKLGLETDWHMKDGLLPSYVSEVRAARKRWEGRLGVYLGFELDYIKGLGFGTGEGLAELEPDYLIGSVHYVIPPGGGLENAFTVDEPPELMAENIVSKLGGDGEAMMHAYWDAVLEMVKLGGFDIVGHLDLVKKNNAGNRWFDEKGGAYMQRAEEAVRAIAAAGLVVEANTGGMNRGSLDETYPSLPILRLLRRHEVQITISADAHRAADVAGHYGEAGRILRSAGYAGHVLFAGRSGGKPVWLGRAI